MLGSLVLELNGPCRNKMKSDRILWKSCRNLGERYPTESVSWKCQDIQRIPTLRCAFLLVKVSYRMSRIGHHRFPTPRIRLSVLNQDSDEISRKSDRNLIGTDQIRLDPILGLNLLGSVLHGVFTSVPHGLFTIIPHGVFTSIPHGLFTGVLYGVLTSVPHEVFTRVAHAISARVLCGVLTGVFTGVFTGVLTGTFFLFLFVVYHFSRKFDDKRETKQRRKRNVFFRSLVLVKL